MRKSHVALSGIRRLAAYPVGAVVLALLLGGASLASADTAAALALGSASAPDAPQPKSPAQRSDHRGAQTSAARCLGRPATMVVSGRRRVRGTKGPDVIVVRGPRPSRVDARGGNDRICGGRGDDVLIGGGGQDLIDGGAGADRLFGKRGRDRIWGRAGRDLLVAGAGPDVLRGGRGRDRFVARHPRARTDLQLGEFLNGRQKTLAAKLRRSSTEVPGSRLGAVRRKGHFTEVVLHRDVKIPRRGHNLVIPVSKQAPEGVLGKVVGSHRLKSGATQVRTRPATLDEAYSKFKVAFSGSLADFNRPAPSRLGASAEISSLTARPRCSGTGSTAKSLRVDPGAIHVDAYLSADPQFPYFYLTIGGKPLFSLNFEASGSAKCEFPLLKQRTKCKNFGPLFLCFTPLLKLTADGRISLGYEWRPIFRYELRRAGYTPSRNRDRLTFESHGTPRLEGNANAQARLHLGAHATVAGALGLLGALAPHVDGSVGFRTPPPRACAKASAAIDYNLTAYANVFVKRWDWKLAKGEFLRRTLFDRCAGSSDGSGSSDEMGSTGQPYSPSGRFIQVSAGGGHICLLFENGTATCDGLNGEGQASPPSGAFDHISAGGLHTCGLRKDGTGVCWGFDGDGRASPPSGTFDQISAGESSHTCGLRGEGTAVCWGADDYGQASPPSGEFVQISAGGLHTCGLRENGIVSCWGDDHYGETASPNGTFDQISAGGNHTCGLRGNGTVVCWGRNSEGQASPPSGAFDQVSAGGLHTCGLRLDGTAACWGADFAGEASPPGETFDDLSAGGVHTCGLRPDGIAVCWGNIP